MGTRLRRASSSYPHREVTMARLDTPLKMEDTRCSSLMGRGIIHRFLFRKPERMTSTGMSRNMVRPGCRIHRTIPVIRPLSLRHPRPYPRHTHKDTLNTGTSNNQGLDSIIMLLSSKRAREFPWPCDMSLYLLSRTISKFSCRCRCIYVGYSPVTSPTFGKNDTTLCTLDFLWLEFAFENSQDQLGSSP